MPEYFGEMIFRTFDISGTEHDLTFDCSHAGMAMHQIMSLLNDQKMYLENESIRSDPKRKANLELLIHNLTGLIYALGLSVDEAEEINRKYDDGQYDSLNHAV